MLELDDLVQRLESSKARVSGAKQDLMERVGQKVTDKVKQFTPVDTRRLQDSIHHTSISSDSVSVISDVEYAPYVDKGHATRSGTFVPGHHMFDKAMLQADAVIETEADRFLRKINLLG